jgi:hypothetical protein
MIPMMEVAAANVASQRSSMSSAAGSAGIHSPAGYMRQAMDRSSRPSSPPANATTGGTTYAHARTTDPSSEQTTSEGPRGQPSPGARHGQPSDAAGGTVEPSTRWPSATSPTSTQPRSPTATEAPPTRSTPPPSAPAERPRPPEPPPPPTARRSRPPEPPPDRGPPRDGGDH